MLGARRGQELSVPECEKNSDGRSAESEMSAGRESSASKMSSINDDSFSRGAKGICQKVRRDGERHIRLSSLSPVRLIVDFVTLL
jgi:hypothetical protein